MKEFVLEGGFRMMGDLEEDNDLSGKGLLG
jgi:hypothetical protein